MWPRVVEVMLGAWLVITPLVFRGTADVERYTINAVLSGSIVVTASLTAFWRRAAWMRFVTLAVACWLAGHGYLSAVRPGPPAAQNEIMVGLLLLLFAILPNDVNRSPAPDHAPGDDATSAPRAG